MLMVGLLSKDLYYRKKLSEALMVKGEKTFNLYSFSDSNHLNQIKGKIFLDVLLIEEEEYNRIKEVTPIHSVSKYCIILTDQITGELLSDQENSSVVYMSKYSTAGSMVQRIHECYPNTSASDCRIIGIASPVHSCGKTSLAYQLCEQLQEKGETLLIVMDHRNPLFTSKECGLSWIMYELYKGFEEEDYTSLEGNCMSQEVFHQLLRENVKQFDHVSYLPACDYKDEMEMVQDSYMRALIALLRQDKHYSYIVIDFNEQLLYGESVTSCDVIICPTKNDCFSAVYSRRYLNNLGSKNTLELTLPQVAIMSTPEDYYRELQWSALGGVTQQLVKELSL